MRVLVLGAYGLIGAEVVRRLRADGVDVVGFGRSRRQAMRAAPDMTWRIADLATMRTPGDWRPLLAGVDAVVNAAGALQDGARDNLVAVQSRAIEALVSACEDAGVRRFVQISAPGAALDASTAFLRTKAAADRALRRSKLDWVVLKPGLVWSADAYGGTSLVRQLAAFPAIQPLMSGATPIQTVAGADVADAVAWSLSPQAHTRADYDLVEPSSQTLRDLVGQVRQWLGIAPALAHIETPSWIGALLARLGDGAGWLGWRPALRSTTLRVLADGVHGDGAPYLAASGRALRPLRETLALTPATAQERAYARAQLLFPALLVTLSAFWLATGVIGLWRWNAAADVLAQSPAAPVAPALVVLGALADIAIGLGVLVRPTTVIAAWAAVAMSLAYLALGTALTPHLWADPLGPLLKILPQAALAAGVAMLAPER